VPQFVVERPLPGAGALSSEELQQLSRRWSAALDPLGPSVQWVHSYVAGDRVFCIYRARDVELIRNHAVLAGHPESVVTECHAVLLPALAG
jgi:hypothetical protein